MANSKLDVVSVAALADTIDCDSSRPHIHRGHPHLLPPSMLSISDNNFAFDYSSDLADTHVGR